MKISVVIPTYNRARTLPRALDSVLNQTLPAAEILIVDDGSSDQTAKLIRERYPQCRYRYQPNLGVSRARNLGITSAQEEWIALLDSDDAWLPNKLQRQADALEAHGEYRLCHTEEIWIRNGVRVNAMKKHAKQGGRIFRNCLPLCVISPSSALLHRSLFAEVGLFDPALPACEDYDLWLRICAREAVLFLDEPLIVKYGGHQDQLSRKHWGMDRFRIQALEKIVNSGVLDEADRDAAVQTLIDKAKIFSQGAEKRGNLSAAARYQTLWRSYLSMIG